MKKIVFLALVLVLLSTAVVTEFIIPVVASGTIYIRSDGSVEGTDKIQRDGNIYTFTGDISIDYGDCGIEVDMDNILIDGAGFTLQGTAAYISRGIDLSGRSNVTIRNMEIRNFMDGIYLVPSSNNTITRNNITANTGSGIWTAGVSNNIAGNYIANNEIGILFEGSHDLIYHNNFINNTKQVEDICWTNPWLPSSANILDGSYPSGGNYWSDYTDVDQYSGPYQNETGSDGIWDHPYIIDENNQDNYPLIHLYGSIRNLDTNLTYLTIQSAIDAPETLDGQTILVDAGTYCDHVNINKSISLIGENRSTTIIDGNETGTIVTITTGNVSISGFTIQHGGFDQSSIYISSSSDVTINDNAISNNFEGIHLNSSNGNDIADNLISPYAAVGIFLNYSNGNVIRGNIINPEIGLDQIGILLTHSTENSIINNTILNNLYDGIKLIWDANANVISGNNIKDNGYGVLMVHSGNNTLYHNNFINNGVSCDDANTWDNGYLSGGNYWSDYEERYPNATEIDDSGLWDTPYFIDESNQDNYPIIPEFSTWTSMLLVFTLLTVVIAIYKRRLLKTSIH